MSVCLSVEEFLQLGGQCIDIRSPGEFSHAHIPTACSVPLFTDSERAAVGTVYKKVGRKEAVRLGVSLVGPKLPALFEALEQIPGTKKIYCWRGGMRSSFVCNFLSSLQIPCVQLEGGYKAFRRKMLSSLQQPPALVVLGGMTGSGKTEFLRRFQGPHIDLEALACHRGSVFGEEKGVVPPSNEQFENMLAFSLRALPKNTALLVEDESRMIGSCTIPDAFYNAMQEAPVVVLETPKQQRIERILRLYGDFSAAWWCEKTVKIQKRLGSQMTNQALAYIGQGRLFEAIDLLLTYYDKAYEHALNKHKGPKIRCSEEQVLDALRSVS